LPGEPGYFTATFCEKARYLRPENGARVDAIRNRIEELALRPELRAVLLVSLMEAADRVDSTTGVQMAYLKEWAPRSANELTLRMPELLPRATAGKGRALALDALEFVRSEEARGADVAYLDPPYNQHSYLGNYHVWETLVRWDEPETYGVACKRTDCQERKSPYNSKRRCLAALEELIAAIDAPSMGLGLGLGVHCGGCAQAGSAPASLGEKMRTASSQG
jgi:adenine-specific DNA-methyltransferase